MMDEDENPCQGDSDIHKRMRTNPKGAELPKTAPGPTPDRFESGT